MLSLKKLFLLFASQCLLGLCNYNSLGGDSLSTLSSARYGSLFLFLFLRIAVSLVSRFYLCWLINHWCLSSEQWRDCGSGEPGWHPKASVALPQRGTPPPVPHLSGDRPAASRTAGPTTLESERKGEQRDKILGILSQLLNVLSALNVLKYKYETSLFPGEGFPQTEKEESAWILWLCIRQGGRWGNWLCVSNHLSWQPDGV